MKFEQAVKYLKECPYNEIDIFTQLCFKRMSDESDRMFKDIRKGL